MSVTLILAGVLAKLADGRTIEAEGATVGDVIDRSRERYPALAPRLRDDGGRAVSRSSRST